VKFRPPNAEVMQASLRECNGIGTLTVNRLVLTSDPKRYACVRHLTKSLT
jgi:hypothetical protein